MTSQQPYFLMMISSPDPVSLFSSPGTRNPKGPVYSQNFKYSVTPPVTLVEVSPSGKQNV